MNTFLLAATPLATAFMAGAFVSVQAAVNSTLGKTLGHPIWAALVSLIVSLVIVVAALVALRIEPPSFRSVQVDSWWIWTGGIAGAVYLGSAVALPSRLGAGTFILLVIAGQMLASLLIDRFGLFGMNARPIGILKYLGVLMMVGGLLISQIDVKG